MLTRVEHNPPLLKGLIMKKIKNKKVKGTQHACTHPNHGKKGRGCMCNTKWVIVD